MTYPLVAVGRTELVAQPPEFVGNPGMQIGREEVSFIEVGREELGIDSDSDVAVEKRVVESEVVTSEHPGCEIGRLGMQTPPVVVGSADSDEIRVELSKEEQSAQMMEL